MGVNGMTLRRSWKVGRSPGAREANQAVPSKIRGLVAGAFPSVARRQEFGKTRQSRQSSLHFLREWTLVARTLTEHSENFRPDLQGLRAVAIVLVILAHAGLKVAPGGFVGVDVFLVLSGYLITGLLFRELAQDGRIVLTSFYARRLKRLLPAMICMLVATSGVAFWLLSGVEARAQLASAPFAATWTSNLYFSFITLDYFDELATRDLFLHTWSLGVEEQFYLIWPVLLLILFRIGKLLPTSQDNGRRLMVFGLGTACVASLALSLYWTDNRPQAAFYMMPSRIWQLSLGALVCLTFQTGSSGWTSRCLSRFPRHFLLGSGLLMILGSAAGLSPDLAYPGFWALLPSFGAALVIVSGHALPKGHQGLLARPILVWLGDRSYSLYLWHWPVFVLGFSLGLQGQLVPTLGLILVSLVAAILSFRWIELPFWKGRWSHAGTLGILLPGLLVMATVVIALDQGLRQLPQADAASEISNKWRTDSPVIYGMSCDAWYANAHVEPCVLGSKTATKTVVLLGDSIGTQWFSILPEIFPEPAWRIVVLTKSSCAMVDEDYYYQPLGKTYQVCTDWRNAVLDELDRILPEVLIMGSTMDYRFTETQWVEGSSRIFDRVSKAARTVFVIPGTPGLGFDGPGCLARHLLPDGRIDRGPCLARHRLQHIASITNSLGVAAGRFANVHLLDLNDLVCPGGICSAVSDQGVVVFRDSHHLTDSFVRAQIPFVRERLKRFAVP